MYRHRNRWLKKISKKQYKKYMLSHIFFLYTLKLFRSRIYISIEAEFISCKRIIFSRIREQFFAIDDQIDRIIKAIAFSGNDLAKDCIFFILFNYDIIVIAKSCIITPVDLISFIIIKWFNYKWLCKSFIKKNLSWSLDKTSRFWIFCKFIKRRN